MGGLEAHDCMIRKQDHFVEASHIAAPSHTGVCRWNTGAEAGSDCYRISHGCWPEGLRAWAADTLPLALKSLMAQKGVSLRRIGPNHKAHYNLKKRTRNLGSDTGRTRSSMYAYLRSAAQIIVVVTHPHRSGLNLVNVSPLLPRIFPI